MTKGHEWAMKFEAIAGKLTNAQYANLAQFFNYVIEEERVACLEVVEAWIRPDSAFIGSDAYHEGRVASKIARKIRARKTNGG